MGGSETVAAGCTAPPSEGYAKTIGQGSKSIDFPPGPPSVHSKRGGWFRESVSRRTFTHASFWVEVRIGSPGEQQIRWPVPNFDTLRLFGEADYTAEIYLRFSVATRLEALPFNFNADHAPY